MLCATLLPRLDLDAPAGIAWDVGGAEGATFEYIRGGREDRKGPRKSAKGMDERELRPAA